MYFIKDKLHLTSKEFQELDKISKFLQSPDQEVKRLAIPLLIDLLPERWELTLIESKQCVMVNYSKCVWAYKKDWIIDENK